MLGTDGNPIRRLAQPAAGVLDADRTADTRSFIIVSGLLIASFLVETTSLLMEPNGEAAGWVAPFVLEGSSHAVLLALFPALAMVLTRAPLAAETWRWAVPVHLAAFVTFTVVHVLAFAAIRTVVFAALGERYGFELTDPLVWIYELRKDAFTYVLFVLLIALNRAAQYRRLEQRAAQEDARAGGQITLKCG
ncbi:MAG: hypothetical protein AAFW98_11375, partial [Pseudomonadota bacterium]